VDETRYAVEKSQPQDVEAEKPRERRHQQPPDARTLAAPVHRLGLERRITVLLRDVRFERLRRCVQQIAGEPRDGTVDGHVLVHGIVGPASMAPIEKPHDPVRVAFAMGKPAPEKPVAPCHRKRRRGGRIGQSRANRGTKLRRDALVGIEAEHPIVRGVLHGEILLRPEALPRLHDDPRAAAAGDFHGIITAARIDHDDLTGERRGREAFRELSGRVARDHTKTQGKLRGHARDDRGAVGAAREDDARILRVFAGRLSPPPVHRERTVTGILVVRPSSLGDIVHALALVADVRDKRPGLAVDWVAEETFAPLVALDPGVRRVIPVALRRWRGQLLATSTWREMADFRNDLRREEYAAVLDLQEQVKGAFIARLARGPRHGPDRASIREPVATLAHDLHHAIDPDQHLIDRCRQLAAAALRYTVDGPPRFGLVPPAARPGSAMPSGPYMIFLHATSRADKLWPEANWSALIGAFAQAGFAVLLPWGNPDERARSDRLAQTDPAALVPPRLPLDALAGLLARAELVVGVDTGLVHLAAALGTPTVSLFVATDAKLAGVERANALARDLGGIGQVPSVAAVLEAAGALRRRAPGT